MFFLKNLILWPLLPIMSNDDDLYWWHEFIYTAWFPLKEKQTCTSGTSCVHTHSHGECKENRFYSLSFVQTGNHSHYSKKFTSQSTCMNFCNLDSSEKNSKNFTCFSGKWRTESACQTANSTRLWLLGWTLHANMHMYNTYIFKQSFKQLAYKSPCGLAHISLRIVIHMTVCFYTACSTTVTFI